MEINSELACLFSAEVDIDSETATIELPAREIELGTLEPGSVVRVAILDRDEEAGKGEDTAEALNGEEVESADASTSSFESAHPTPPVSEGEQRVVEIETIGDQGDGIARVERGFVIIVPGTQKGDRVTVEIENVHETVAFGKVVSGQ